MVRKLTKRIGLVPNWQKCWKWATVQLSAGVLFFFSALDLIQLYSNSIPSHILKEIPHSSEIIMWVCFLNIVARLFHLKPKEPSDADKE